MFLSCCHYLTTVPHDVVFYVSILIIKEQSKLTPSVLHRRVFKTTISLYTWEK